ncbi:MAG: ABC transporter substrate-binding protein [Treponema sp.]|jgi:branched-chain amino acid transport system substrate-binding protein|nr:ABC transporter substrate-binding protein [Treponema sp.]
MKKLLIVAVLLLACVSLFAGGRGQSAVPDSTASDGFDASWNASPTIKLGVAITLTGTQSNPGKHSEQGVDIAVEQINAAGGIHGKKIELIKYDDKGQPAEALKAITRLIEQDKVHIIMGPLSSNSVMAVGEYVNDAEVPAIGVAVGIVWLNQGWTYYFRSSANTGVTATTLFKTIKESGAKTMGYFNINEEFGNNFIKDMDGLIAADGNKIAVTVQEKYKDGDTDFTAQCVKIKQADPDCLFVASWSNDAGQLIKQVRAAGYDKPIYGDTAFSAAPVRQIAGAATNNCFFANAYVLPDSIADIDTNPSFAGKAINGYLKAYVAKYGDVPKEDNAYRSYDAINIFAKAIGNAKSLKGSDIRDAIHAISDYDGILGRMNYARFPNGECVDEVAMWEIKDGKVIPYRR